LRHQSRLPDRRLLTQIWPTSINCPEKWPQRLARSLSEAGRHYYVIRNSPSRQYSWQYENIDHSKMFGRPTRRNQPDGVFPVFVDKRRLTLCRHQFSCSIRDCFQQAGIRYGSELCSRERNPRRSVQSCWRERPRPAEPASSPAMMVAKPPPVSFYLRLWRIALLRPASSTARLTGVHSALYRAGASTDPEGGRDRHYGNLGSHKAAIIREFISAATGHSSSSKPCIPSRTLELRLLELRIWWWSSRRHQIRTQQGCGAAPAQKTSAGQGLHNHWRRVVLEPFAALRNVADPRPREVVGDHGDAFGSQHVEHPDTGLR